MTASQLHALPVPPMLTTNSGTSSSVIPNRTIGNNTNSRSRAKRNLFGSPEPGEVKRICDADNIRRCNEIKDKYSYDIQNDRFTNNINNNNNNKNEDENEITTTTTTTTTKQITELNNNGQDEQSNINILTATNEIDNINVKSIIDVPSIIKTPIISKNLLIKTINSHDSECYINGNDATATDAATNDDNNDKLLNNNNIDHVDNEVGKSNNMSLNGNKLNNSFNKCDVMCNQINSTTSSTITSSTSIAIATVPTIKDKKSIEIVQQRFSPYCKKQSQQTLISDTFKVRKASPVNIITRPQKAKLHFDEIDQQQQEQHLTSNEV